MDKLIQFMQREKKALLMALLTLVFYVWLANWQFALLLMATIGLHECGHLYAAKHRGIRTYGFTFIPLFGGVAKIDLGGVTTTEQNGFIAIAGPGVGVVMALLSWAVFALTHHAWWGAASAFIAVINLFNLAPIYPLDGGRIWHGVATSIRPQFGKVMIWCGLVAAIGLGVYLRSPVYFLIGGLAVMEHLGMAKVKNSNGLAAQANLAACDAELAFFHNAAQRDPWMRTSAEFLRRQVELFDLRMKAETALRLAVYGPQKLTLRQGAMLVLEYAVTAAVLLAVLLSVIGESSWRELLRTLTV